MSRSLEKQNNCKCLLRELLIFVCCWQQAGKASAVSRKIAANSFEKLHRETDTHKEQIRGTPPTDKSINFSSFKNLFKTT